MQMAISVEELRTGFTVISIVAGAAHCCPGLGVKVYLVVFAESVEIFAGLQVPVMPLSDDSGNDGAIEF